MLPHEVEGGNGARSTLIVGTEDAYTSAAAQRGVDEVCRSVKMLMRKTEDLLSAKGGPKNEQMTRLL